MRVTIKDVAKEAGVPVSTASYVLNRKDPPIKERHKRVVEAAEKLGYVPDATARSLVNSRTNNFAVIIGYNPAIENDPYDIELIKSFSTAFARAGCWMSLYMDDYRHPERLDALLTDAKTDGLVIVRGEQLSENSLRLIERRRLPLITYESYVPVAQARVAIHVNPAPGMRQAVDHLAALGHRDICAFNFRQTSNRFLAAKRRMEELGMELRCFTGSGLDKESVYRDMLSYLDGGAPIPTAFLAPTDLSALGMVSALAERGHRVPEDVSVIGYDDIYEARNASPALTTISQNIPATVEMICQKLIDLREAAGPEEQKSVGVDTSLVVRGSTAPPRSL